MIQPNPASQSHSPRRPRPKRPTWEIAHLFPRQGAWTEADFFALDALGNEVSRVELSDGRLEILPVPTQAHQVIIGYLYQMLTAFTVASAPGMVVFCGMRMRLSLGDRVAFRLPDLLYMKAENAPRRHNEYWEGADLVMEIVSPDAKDRRRDLVIKAAEYAQGGIAEYWIIDPELEEIRVLTLEGSAYRVHGIFRTGTQATSVLLAGFAVEVDRVFAVANA